MTHAELIDYVKHLPRDSATSRALVGAASDYDPHMHRLTDITDLLIAANWQRAGGKGTKPKPIRRPRPRIDL